MKDTESILTSLLTDEAFQKMKSTVVTRVNEIEKELLSKIDDLETKANSKVDNLENYITNKPLSVNFGTIEEPKNEITHKKFNTIIKVLQSRKRIEKNIMLVGPAGSSKSYLCSQVAKALNLSYHPMSLGSQSTMSSLIGYMNAYGNYITTPIREAYENGGICTLDEVDSANSGVLTILNGMLSSDTYSFPDKIVKKHENFVCIATANTYGLGADLNYVGRNRLDGATLDRFIVINIDYDEQLEEYLTKNKEWFNIVRKIRDNATKNGLKVIVSPRASMNGADLLDAGISANEVLEMTILKGLSNDIRQQILRDVNLSKLTKKSKNDKHKNTNTRIELCINFDSFTYELKNVEQDTSIIAKNDWVGEHSIYISCANNWVNGLNNKKLYLNSGKHDFKQNKPTSADIRDFLRDLELNYESIIVEYQPIFIQCTYNNTTHAFCVQ